MRFFLAVSGFVDMIAQNQIFGKISRNF